MFDCSKVHIPRFDSGFLSEVSLQCDCFRGSKYIILCNIAELFNLFYNIGS